MPNKKRNRPGGRLSSGFALSPLCTFSVDNASIKQGAKQILKITANTVERIAAINPCNVGGHIIFIAFAVIAIVHNLDGGDM